MDVYHKNFPGSFTWEKKWQETLSAVSVEVKRTNAVDKFIKTKYGRTERDQGEAFSQTFGGIDENDSPQDHAVSDIAELGVGFDDNGFQWAKA
ncbi:MAG: hypothetical protein IPJ30_04000 [Acidobacteria bacterium]|nr:hypothetical protein [Acidobacteriota bacterium]